MLLQIHTVDAFSQEPFKGNPAAVCVTAKPIRETLMQSIAMEMNLSETAFVVPLDDDGRTFSIRWFTPTLEVPLCGHATLASAHVLFNTGVAKADIQFQTKFRGELQASRRGDQIALNFPANCLRPFSNVRMKQQLELALGCTSIAMMQAAEDIIVEIASCKTLANLRPDFLQLSEIPIGGVIVTARSDEPGFDFKSRYFAPRVGINEDPVTGYAHCSLTPYWARALDKTSFRAKQVSARSGVLELQLLAPNRVELVGHARTMLKAELDLGGHA